MRRAKKKPVAPAAQPRLSHSRQRQRLIDACISALHIYGPSRTTVAKVVAIAKMSPGIVRFYFASKAAMLVASLQFLAAEFQEQLMLPVARLKARPVAALELLVQLYLDPDLASPRKVSVWYSFWGEASSRQEYYDICGQLDENFTALVRELIEAMIAQTSQPQLDPDAIALGLSGVLEMLWQDFAFRDESDIDRVAARERCMAYLHSIFPSQFDAGLRRQALDSSDSMPLSSGIYDDKRLFELERQRVFQGAWQFVAHCSEVQRSGDFVTIDLGIERVLLWRDATNTLRAFRNNCTASPHTLVTANRGHALQMSCPIHGPQFGSDGTSQGQAAAAPLQQLQLTESAGLLLVRVAAARDNEVYAWAALPFTDGLRPRGVAAETTIAADWKLVIDQWPAPLDTDPAQSWSADRYRGIVGKSPPQVASQFMFPNHWLTWFREGAEIRQVIPLAPGRSILRTRRFSFEQQNREGVAAGYLQSRVLRENRRVTTSMLSSIQRSLLMMGQRAPLSTSASAKALYRELHTLLPELGQWRLARPT